MADLNRDDRAQLFLVTALAIGVASIALILLLNGAIYTQNISSRALAADDRQAIEETETFVGSAEALLEAENARNHSSKDAVYRNLSAAIGGVTDMQRRHKVRRGVFTGTSGVTLANGTEIHQDSNATLESAAPRTNWQVASGAWGLRSSTLKIQDVTQTDDPVNDSFVLQIEGGGGTRWNLSVFEEDPGGALNISTSTDGPPLDQVCESAYTGTPVTISLTNASINGTACGELAYWETVSQPYDIDIFEGNNASGTYQLVVNTTTVGTLNDYGGGDPYKVPVVYSVNGTFEYQSRYLDYARQFRIAPGEPDG